MAAVHGVNWAWGRENARRLKTLLRRMRQSAAVSFVSLGAARLGSPGPLRALRAPYAGRAMEARAGGREPRPDGRVGGNHVRRGPRRGREGDQGDPRPRQPRVPE